MAGVFSDQREAGMGQLLSQFCRQWLPFVAAIALHLGAETAIDESDCAEVEGSTVTA